jgi:phosphoglycolate phosphatase
MTASIFKTVVFDLDGTIVDTAADLGTALNVALQAVGRQPVGLPAVRQMIGHGTRALLRNGLAATGGADDALMQTAYPILMRAYEEHICDLTRPYPGVEDAFGALAAQGTALALCTNKPERPTLDLLDALGWRERFAAIVAGDTLAVAKPDPAPLRLAIERAGGGPAAFVGDSIVDVQTAAAAGIPCVLVSFGFSDRPARDLGAQAVIDEYTALVPLLAALAAGNR